MPTASMEAAMGGRVKRKAATRAGDERAARSAATPVCALCGRPLGLRVEWHHRIPKSEGGQETVPVHPICHRTIHAVATNGELAGALADLETLRATPAMERFLRWIAGKPADFHAPTRNERHRSLR